MTLLGVKEQKGWLYSEWKMTYNAGWDQIVNAAAALYHRCFESPELLFGKEPIKVNNMVDILGLKERSGITIRGMCKAVGVPVMLDLINQTGVARAIVAMANEEFSRADYERFNKSMSQFMDSIDVIMFGGKGQ